MSERVMVTVATVPVSHLAVAFADTFDVDAPSELPEEAVLHQDAAGGLWDLRRRRSYRHDTDTEPHPQTGVLTWILPLTPVLSILLAKFTVVPQMSY